MKLNIAFLFFVVLAISGCGSDKAEVKGTVKLDGEALPDGEISFAIEGSNKGGNAKITNGNYTAEVSLGKAKVQITASKKVPLPPGEKGMYGDKEEVRQYLPEKYNSKSELSADITGPNSSLNFDLKSSK